MTCGIRLKIRFKKYANELPFEIAAPHFASFVMTLCPLILLSFSGHVPVYEIVSYPRGGKFDP